MATYLTNEDENVELQSADKFELYEYDDRYSRYIRRGWGRLRTVVTAIVPLTMLVVGMDLTANGRTYSTCWVQQPPTKIQGANEANQAIPTQQNHQTWPIIASVYRCLHLHPQPQAGGHGSPHQWEGLSMSILVEFVTDDMTLISITPGCSLSNSNSMQVEKGMHQADHHHGPLAHMLCLVYQEEHLRTQWLTAHSKNMDLAGCPEVKACGNDYASYPALSLHRKKKHKRLLSQVTGQVVSQVTGQVVLQVTGQVVLQVTGQVVSQVTGQVVSQVTGQVVLQVTGQVVLQVTGQVVLQVTGQVVLQVTGQVVLQVTGQVVC
eukprot:Em0004g639a